MNGLEIMFWLIFAHVIGDMSLQTSFVALNKGKRLYLMFSHVMIYIGTVGIALLLLNIFSWYSILFIVIGHFLMDSWKSKQPKDDEHFYQIYIDQGWHYFQLLIVVIFSI